MVPMAELVRAYNYRIRTYQVGSDGRLSLHHLFNLFQDVAHRDATNYGFGYPQMLRHKRLWVLSRMSIEIDDLPKYDEAVSLLTWVKSVSGPSSEREFALVFNNERLVRAASLWVSLSAENHRPATIPMSEKLAELLHAEPAIVGGAEKILFDSSSFPKLQSTRLQAKYSDIDLVNHVNNATYVRWIMDDIKINNPEAAIGSFSVNYLNEVHLGEEVELRQFRDTAKTLVHELVQADTEQLVCRSKTVRHTA